MGIPRIYRGVEALNLASYDFYDLFTGTGYKDFYLADAIVTATDTKMITLQEIYSDVGYTQHSNAAGDDDFDITINVPMTIEGDLTFNVFFSSSSDLSGGIDVSFKLYRVDSASVEHQIGGTTTKTITPSNDNELFSGKVTLPVTRIKAGEILRVNITTEDPGAGKVVRVLHDPKNRDVSGAGGFISSASLINLPIRL